MLAIRAVTVPKMASAASPIPCVLCNATLPLYHQEVESVPLPSLIWKGSVTAFACRKPVARWEVWLPSDHYAMKSPSGMWTLVPNSAHSQQQLPAMWVSRHKRPAQLRLYPNAELSHCPQLKYEKINEALCFVGVYYITDSHNGITLWRFSSRVKQLNSSDATRNRILI